jgi:polysaccharide export outer membrane protein
MGRNVVLLILIGLCVSCATRKKILYLQNSEELLQDVSFIQGTIQPNDILKITINTILTENSLPYNNDLPSGNNGNVEVQKLSGYLVDNNGYIHMPILNDFLAIGKTIEELSNEINTRLVEENHLNNPTVLVRLINAKVTVLGEVSRPGTYSYTEQNLSLFQTLGLAGDLTINGNRKNVMVVRQDETGRHIEHIDLTSIDWFSSEYYYVKQNDIIIVNPNGPKVKKAGYVGEIGTLLTITSMLLSTVIIITNIK